MPRRENVTVSLHDGMYAEKAKEFNSLWGVTTSIPGELLSICSMKVVLFLMTTNYVGQVFEE